MVNPYQSPRSPIEKNDSRAAVGQSSRPYFTHITVKGCNLLGLANFFTFVGLLTLLITTMPAGNRALAVVLLGLVVCGCSGFDLALRVLNSTGSRLTRLLSPFAGGALAFIPVWIIYPVMVAVGLILVLNKG